MKLLALDLGTHTGAARRSNEVVHAETWNLPTPKKGKCSCAVDPRIPQFRLLLGNILDAEGPFDGIVYEDVKFMKGRAQAFLWSAFRTVLWLVAHDKKLPVFCIATNTLKKFATGNGAADKDEMAAALFSLDDITDMPHNASDLDDNAVDAVHLLLWAEKTFGPAS